MIAVCPNPARLDGAAEAVATIGVAAPYAGTEEPSAASPTACGDGAWTATQVARAIERLPF
jgi:hypothetical protein